MSNIGQIIRLRLYKSLLYFTRFILAVVMTLAMVSCMTDGANTNLEKEKTLGIDSPDEPLLAAEMAAQNWLYAQDDMGGMVLANEDDNQLGIALETKPLIKLIGYDPKKEPVPYEKWPKSLQDALNGYREQITIVVTGGFEFVQPMGETVNDSVVDHDFLRNTAWRIVKVDTAVDPEIMVAVRFSHSGYGFGDGCSGYGGMGGNYSVEGNRFINELLVVTRLGCGSEEQYKAIDAVLDVAFDVFATSPTLVYENGRLIVTPSANEEGITQTLELEQLESYFVTPPLLPTTVPQQ